MARQIIMPVRIEDPFIEESADLYRKKCGSNDLLIHKGQVVEFEYFLSLRIIARDMQATLAAFDQAPAW